MRLDLAAADDDILAATCCFEGTAAFLFRAPPELGPQSSSSSLSSSLSSLSFWTWLSAEPRADRLRLSAGWAVLGELREVAAFSWPGGAVAGCPWLSGCPRTRSEKEATARGGEAATGSLCPCWKEDRCVLALGASVDSRWWDAVAGR